MDINATRVSPIISALAVAAVRRGLRRAFSVARTPTDPNSPPVADAQAGHHRPTQHRGDQCHP